jgi:hypothetical protein
MGCFTESCGGFQVQSSWSDATGSRRRDHSGGTLSVSLSSRTGGRSLRARAATAAIVIAGLGSVVFYAAISATINGRPSTQPFQGWVALLQPSGSPSGDQVKLVAKALVPGAPGQHPAMSYTVVACGSQPFRGVLLMGGDARLADLHGFPALGTSSTPAQASAEDLSDLIFFDVQTGSVINLGPVQAVHIAMTNPFPCASAYAPQQVPPPEFFGQAQVVTGLAAAPVQRPWKLGWWSGPRTSQVWTLVGTLPGVSFNDLGEFQAIRGLGGTWGRSRQQYFAVNVSGLQARASLDEVQPALASSTALYWDSAQPLQPTAVVTDTDSLSTLQQWLIAAAISLGIGGSLLASLVFEWARPPRPQDQPTTRAGPSSACVTARQAQPSRPAAGPLAAFALLAFLAWLLRAGRRRRTR